MNLSCWKFCQSIFLTNFRKVAFVLEGFLILPNVTRNIQIFCFYFERKRRVHCLANLQFGDQSHFACKGPPAGNLKRSSFPKSPDHKIAKSLPRREKQLSHVHSNKAPMKDPTLLPFYHLIEISTR